MRDIKYRGRRLDNGEWAYGSYHCTVGEASLHEHLYNGGYKTVPVTLNVHWILQQSLPDTRGWDIKDTYRPFKVSPETIGEFTGLKDKNGKEIYEGDKVIVLSGETAVVVFRNGSFMLEWIGFDAYADLLGWIDFKKCCEYSSESFEVVGNIYENAPITAQ